jgi:hypothetical protein
MVQYQAMQAENSRRMAEARQRHAGAQEAQAREAEQALAGAKAAHAALCAQLTADGQQAEAARQAELERLQLQVGGGGVGGGAGCRGLQGAMLQHCLGRDRGAWCGAPG